MRIFSVTANNCISKYKHSAAGKLIIVTCNIVSPDQQHPKDHQKDIDIDI